MTPPSNFFALGLGIMSHNKQGACQEVFFTNIQHQPSIELVKTITKELSIDINKQQKESITQIESNTTLAKIIDLLGGSIQEWQQSKAQPILVLLAVDTALQSVAAAYLKLHLLSHRLCAPNSINLENIFSVLPTIAWTNQGAIAINELATRQRQARINNQILKVYSVDKFPPMSDYVVPESVRIADSARIRLGAWIGAGTTIMHEGFINFNAGTEGPNMVEGRISAGVVIGAQSDLGGGASTMGTLSGGNKQLIAVGQHCLIGANAGIGISLGNGCTVEAGLYLTAGAIVNRLDLNLQSIKQCKARELSGHDNLLFRRNSQNGSIEALDNKDAIELNTQLHGHN